MEIKEMIEAVEDKANSLLINKPIWVFWLVYTGIIALLFGIFYLITTLLLSRWWVPVIIILLLGITWGSFAFVKGTRQDKSS
jgi:hypothetical protein